MIFTRNCCQRSRPWSIKPNVCSLCPELSRTMARVQAAALAWALALLSAFPAAHARKGPREDAGQSSADKGWTEQAQQLKLALEAASLKASLEQDLHNMNTLLEKLGPLSGQGDPPGLPPDSESVRRRLQAELQEVSARLEPRMAEAHARLSWNLQGLRQRLEPYTAALVEQVALRVEELQEQLRAVGEDTKAQLLGGVAEARDRLQELRGGLAHHTGRAKQLLHPPAERLLRGIGQHVRELHRSVAPHALASPARLSRCVQRLSRKLTLKAEALHAGIQQNLDHLHKELSAFGDAEDGAHPDPRALSQEVRQRLQAFRHDTLLQIAAFTRAIDQETQEVQQQLAPPPPSHSAFAPEFLPEDDGKARSRLQARLDDLWEDINYSLRDHDPGHGGEP